MLDSSCPCPDKPVVIVAEDELLIRMMMADFLSEAGFYVLEADRSACVLSILAAQADRVRILFTDVNMPGDMDGLELARHVYNNWPQIALLIASGHATPGTNDLPPKSQFLEKPYIPEQVLSCILEIIKNR